MDNAKSKANAGLILRRSETEVLVPLNEEQLNRLLQSWKARMASLKASGDYPEEEADKRTMDDLATALFMLSTKL